MRPNKKPSINILHVFGGIIFIAVVAVWWKGSSDAERKALQEAATIETHAREELERKREAEKQAFEDQIAAQIAAQEKQRALDTAIESLSGIFLRWKDALTLADSTARIALPGPVGTLQSIRREAQSLVVPACLTEAKDSLVKGMDKSIEGFITFMGNAELGKLMAKIHFDEARSHFAAYEESAKRCS